MSQCDGNWLHSLAPTFLFAVTKNTQGRPFGRTLECGYETEQGKQRAQKPDACIEGKAPQAQLRRDQQSSVWRAYGFLLFRRVWRPVSCRVGSFAILRPSTAARPPAAFSTRPTSRANCSNPPARSTFTASRPARSVIAGSGETCLAHHATEIACEFDPKASGLAGGFHKRQSGTRGRGSAKSHVGGRGDRNSSGGQPQHQLIGFLPGRQAAFPRAVRHGYRRTQTDRRRVVPASAAMSSGSPVTKPRAKLLCLVPRGGSLGGGIFHFVDQCGIERTRRSTARSTKLWARSASLRGQSVFDFALRNRGIEFVVQRMVGNPRRIIEASNRLGRARHRVGRSHSE